MTFESAHIEDIHLQSRRWPPRWGVVAAVAMAALHFFHDEITGSYSTLSDDKPCSAPIGARADGYAMSPGDGK